MNFRFSSAAKTGALCLLGLVLACNKPEQNTDPDEITVPVTGVTISPTTLSLEEGTSETLTAAVKPETATNKEVEWTSSATAVATVDGNGKVTAVKAGTADITVTTKDGAKTASCKVTVTARVIAVTGVTVSPTTLSLEEGASQTLAATVAPDNASNKEVEWKTSATAVATVDGTGKVTAVKAGTADITVTTKDGAKTATCKVTVNAKVIPVTGVTVSPTTLSLEEGDSQTLTATVLPANADNKAVEWKSSATSVATVDANGKVTAVKEGTANITVTTKDGGKTATCKVTVTAKVIPVTGVSWEQKTDETSVGKVISFAVTYTPSNATNATYSWKSSNESVAKIVYFAGRWVNIEAVGVGTTTITATVGGVSITQLVTVKPSVYGVSITTKNKTDEYYISKQDLLLTVDETYTLETQVLSQTDNCDRSVYWQSEYPSNVSVTSLGNGKATVKALAPRLSGSSVLSVKVYAISNENPAAKDYIEVYVYSKPTSITCTTMNDKDNQYLKPGDTRTLAFTVQPATARQGILARTVPTSNGTWSCSVSGMQATVGCPRNPYTEGSTNSRDKFYQVAHSFLFSPLGARNASSPTVQVNMYPCEYYSNDVKPLDYIYYNSSTGKLRMSDGGLRTFHNGITFLAGKPYLQSNETLVGVVTYAGAVNDNLASSNGILSGLSNHPDAHGFAISLSYASSSTKWSDDKDDVQASSNWPSAVGSLYVSGNVFNDSWQNAWSLTQGAIVYNSKVSSGKKIKPAALAISYESRFPTSKITSATHWFVPTFSMGRLGTDKDDKSVFFEINGNYDSNRLAYLNQNIMAAGGVPYNDRCWSINVLSKQYAWTLYSYKGATPTGTAVSPTVYLDKTTTLPVRLWLVF